MASNHFLFFDRQRLSKREFLLNRFLHRRNPCSVRLPEDEAKFPLSGFRAKRAGPLYGGSFSSLVHCDTFVDFIQERFSAFPLGKQTQGLIICRKERSRKKTEWIAFSYSFYISYFCIELFPTAISLDSMVNVCSI
jgi:hypothetical protein